jgi:hypothetical protein
MLEQFGHLAYVKVDYPSPAAMRVTLNRPEKRNALSNALRAEFFKALEYGDSSEDVKVIIIRGAGPAFSAGHDLSANLADGLPWTTAGGAGLWPRHVTEGCFRIWELATPVIGQVHGYCLAGGAELAASCDLLYVGASARIGYPAVRAISPPDNQKRTASRAFLSLEAYTSLRFDASDRVGTKRRILSTSPILYCGRFFLMDRRVYISRGSQMIQNEKSGEISVRGWTVWPGA